MEIKLSVKDDTLITDSENGNIDKVEVWFSIGSRYEGKYILSDSAMYRYKDNSNIEKLKAYLRKPLIGSYNPPGATKYYPLENSFVSFLRDEVEDFLKDLMKSEIKEAYFPFGAVHYGFYPNKDEVIMYDKSLYNPLKDFAGIELDDLTKYIEYKREITSEGYNMLINIKPEALGFIQKNGIKELGFSVKITDVDNTGGNATIFSTSSNSSEGNATNLEFIELKNKISVRLNKDIKELGSWKKSNTIYDNVKSHLPANYVKTKKCWTPVSIKESSFLVINYPDYLFIDSLEKFIPQKIKLDYIQKMIGKTKTEEIDSLIVLDGKMLLKKKNIIRTIPLPDSTLAYLYTEYEVDGMIINKVLNSKLYLVTAESKELIATFQTGALPDEMEIIPYNTGGFNVEKLYKILIMNDLEDNARWENIIEFDLDNNSLFICISDQKKYKISWDKHGKLLRNEVEKEKKKEIR